MAGRNSYDLTVERGIKQRHWNACPARNGKRCTCRPPAYIASATVNRKRIYSRTLRHIDDARTWRRRAIGGLLPEPDDQLPSETLRDTWDRWLAAAEQGTALSRKREPYRPTTIADYTSAMAHVLPLIGDSPTSGIDTPAAQRVIDRLAGTLSPSRVDSAVNALSAVLRWSSRRGTGSPLGPIEHAPTPKRQHEVLRPARVVELLTSVGESATQRTVTAKRSRLTSRAAIAIAAYTGLRALEIVALDRDDVDQHEIHVRHGKTAAAVRTVPVIDLLAPYLDDLPNTGLLFASGRSPQSAYRTIGEHLADGMPDGLALTLHHLRHNFISWMLAAGVPLPASQAISGHATPLVPGVHLGVYGHAPDGHVDDARRRLNAWIKDQSMAA